MVKNYIIVLFFLAFSSSSLSQSFEESKAKDITDQMALALSLTEIEIEKVYQIHLKRFQDVNQIRKQYLDQPKMLNAELKKVFNRLYGKLKEALEEVEILMIKEGLQRCEVNKTRLSKELGVLEL